MQQIYKKMYIYYLKNVFQKFSIIICIIIIYNITFNDVNIFYDIILSIYIVYLHKVIVYLHHKL